MRGCNQLYFVIFVFQFRVQERGIVNETKLCRMYKIKSLEIEYENVTHPPSIWMLPGKRLGFLTPELQLNVDADEAGNQTKFLQIVYKTYYGRPSFIPITILTAKIVGILHKFRCASVQLHWTICLDET